MVIQSIRKKIVLNSQGYHIDEEKIDKDFPSNRKKSRKYFTILAHSFELGFVLSLPIVIGALSGVYLDKNLGTEPKLTLSLIFLGVFISFLNIYNFTKY